MFVTILYDSRDALREDDRVEWFCEVSVGARIQPGSHIRRIAARREKDDRDGARSGIAFEAPAALEAIEIRKHAIVEDDIRPPAADRVQRLGKRGDGDDIELSQQAERKIDNAEHIGLVFDD
jgi:hypothetical protein